MTASRIQRHIICAIIWLAVIWGLSLLVGLPADWRIAIVCWVGAVTEDIARVVTGLDEEGT